MTAHKTTVKLTSLPSNDVITQAYGDIEFRSPALSKDITFNSKTTPDQLLFELAECFRILGVEVTWVTGEELVDTVTYSSRFYTDDDVEEHDLPASFETVDGDEPTAYTAE